MKQLIYSTTAPSWGKIPEYVEVRCRYGTCGKTLALTNRRGLRVHALRHGRLTYEALDTWA